MAKSDIRDASPWIQLNPKPSQRHVCGVATLLFSATHSVNTGPGERLRRREERVKWIDDDDGERPDQHQTIVGWSSQDLVFVYNYTSRSGRREDCPSPVFEWIRTNIVIYLNTYLLQAGANIVFRPRTHICLQRGNHLLATARTTSGILRLNLNRRRRRGGHMEVSSLESE